MNEHDTGSSHTCNAELAAVRAANLYLQQHLWARDRAEADGTTSPHADFLPANISALEARAAGKQLADRGLVAVSSEGHDWALQQEEVGLGASTEGSCVVLCGCIMVCRCSELCIILSTQLVA